MNDEKPPPGGLALQEALKEMTDPRQWAEAEDPPEHVLRRIRDRCRQHQIGESKNAHEDWI